MMLGPGHRVADARTGEVFVITSERGGEFHLRSIDRPGDPARIETTAGLHKSYTLVPGKGHGTEEAAFLRHRAELSTVAVTEAYFKAAAARERDAERYGVEPEDLGDIWGDGVWRRREDLM